jgi:hypothetical protein
MGGGKWPILRKEKGIGAEMGGGLKHIWRNNKGDGVELSGWGRMEG